MRKSLRLAAAGLLIIVFAGCATTSRVHFVGPSGTKVILADRQQEYTIPVILDLRQKENPEALQLNTGGQPIRMVLPDNTELIGYMYVYRIEMDQIERLAEVTFQITDEQIGKIQSGSAVTVTGYSARNQPVYKINLGLDRK